MPRLPVQMRLQRGPPPVRLPMMPADPLLIVAAFLWATFGIPLTLSVLLDGLLRIVKVLCRYVDESDLPW